MSEPINQPAGHVGATASVGCFFVLKITMIKLFTGMFSLCLREKKSPLY